MSTPPPRAPCAALTLPHISSICHVSAHLSAKGRSCLQPAVVSASSACWVLAARSPAWKEGSHSLVSEENPSFPPVSGEASVTESAVGPCGSEGVRFVPATCWHCPSQWGWQWVGRLLGASQHSGPSGVFKALSQREESPFSCVGDPSQTAGCHWHPCCLPLQMGGHCAARPAGHGLAAQLCVHCLSRLSPDLLPEAVLGGAQAEWQPQPQGLAASRGSSPQPGAPRCPNCCWRLSLSSCERLTSLCASATSQPQLTVNGWKEAGQAA